MFQNKIIKTFNIVLYMVLAFLVVLGVLNTYAANPSHNNTNTNTSTVKNYSQVLTIEPRRLQNTLAIGGVVIPYQEVTFTAQSPGRVTYIAGKEGEAFNKGKLVLKLNEDELLAKQSAVYSQIRRAQIALYNANLQYQRQIYDPPEDTMIEQAFGPFGSFFDGDSGLSRSADIYMYLSQMQAAQSELEQSYARLREIQAALRDKRSIAPFDGILVEKYVEVGDPVQPGQPLLRFADSKWKQVKADVNTKIALKLHKGMQLQARFGDGDTVELFPIQVAQIYPMADPNRQTIEVKFTLPLEAPVALGMYIDVLLPDFSAKPQEVIIIPSKAIIYRGGLPMVQVLDKKENIELRLLRLGERYEESVVVLTGLHAGERIVINP